MFLFLQQRLMDEDNMECFDTPDRGKVKWISLFYIQSLEMLLFYILLWMYNHAVEYLFLCWLVLGASG